MKYNLDVRDIIELLKKELPPIFNRRKVQEVLGQIINARTLANLDCQKKGPPRLYLGKTVVYERNSFLKWLESLLTTEEGRLA